MKLLILSQTNQSVLVSFLQDQDQAVILDTSDFELAAPAILRNAPHLIVVCGKPGESFFEQASKFVSGLVDQRLVLHQPGDSLEILQQQLVEARRQVRRTKQRPIADKRIMFFDPEFGSIANDGNILTQNATHTDLLKEQDKLLVLLEGAAGRQEDASRYQRQIQEWSSHELQEIAYRMTHASCIAAHAAREQTGRWLGVFAHYIPAVDLSYLPSPGDAIHGANWIRDGVSPETQYAFGCVEQLGFMRGLSEPTRSLLSEKLATEEDALVVHMALALTGAFVLLQQMAEAHVSIMDRFLIGDAEKLTRDLTEKYFRQAHRRVCEFWELPLLRDYPTLLLKTVDDFHRGRRSLLKIAAPDFLPIFAQSQGQ